MAKNKIAFDQRRFWAKFFQSYATVLVLILLIILIGSLSPSAFFSVRNVFNVLRQISVNALIAIGVTQIIITTGIDLSSGAIVALTAMLAVSLAQKTGWLNPFFPGMHQLNLAVPLISALVLGTFIGFITGLLIAFTGIPPFIVTLGMMTTVRGAAYLYSNGSPIAGTTKAFNFIGQGHLGPIPFPVIILIVAIVLCDLLMRYTRYGKYTYAIGGNVKAAAVSGINVKRQLILVYTLAFFLTSVAGIVAASRIASATPGLGLGYELDAIASTVIGGTSLNGGIGSIWGTVIGALIIGVLNNGLDILNVSPYWQQIVKGLIIIGAVILDQLKNKKRT